MSSDANFVSKDANDWYISDKNAFETGIYQSENSSGECVYLKSIVPRPKNFGFLSRTRNPAEFLGKRLKMSALLKTKLPDGAFVQLWLRADGDWKKRTECFDNMYERRITGQKDWAPYEVAVYVPPTSTKITFGVLLDGTGQLWMAGVLLEPEEYRAE